MSRKLLGIGLVVLSLIGGGILVLSNDGYTPQVLLNSPSIKAPAGPPKQTASRQKEPRSVEVVSVLSRQLEAIMPLSGELLPFLSVDLAPKISGIVDSIKVDRGARVKKGALLLQLSAPELQAQRMEVEALLRAARITHTRLQAAASTPGIVAGNDLELAQHNQEALEARLESLREMEKYLQVTAPFDGVITQRNIHPGALAGPGGPSGQMLPALRLEQMTRLRLIVPVPEVYAGSIANGALVSFTVPAYPQEIFQGIVSRVSQAVDTKTRTMPVEIDVENITLRLAAGMFPEVRWPIQGRTPTLFVPVSAVVTTTEQTFVLQVQNHTVGWTPVRKGTKSGPLLEVFGNLQAGDVVVKRGTDELRAGTVIAPVLVSQE